MKVPLDLSAAALVLILTSTVAMAEEAQMQDRSLLFGRTRKSGSPDDGSNYSMGGGR